MSFESSAHRASRYTTSGAINHSYAQWEELFCDVRGDVGKETSPPARLGINELSRS